MNTVYIIKLSENNFDINFNRGLMNSLSRLSIGDRVSVSGVIKREEKDIIRPLPTNLNKDSATYRNKKNLKKKRKIALSCKN
jgi:hypothetical protein